MCAHTGSLPMTDYSPCLVWNHKCALVSDSFAQHRVSCVLHIIDCVTLSLFPPQDWTIAVVLCVPTAHSILCIHSAVSHLVLSAYHLTADHAVCGYTDAHESLCQVFWCMGTVEMLGYTLLSLGDPLYTSPSGCAVQHLHKRFQILYIVIVGDIEHCSPS